DIEPKKIALRAELVLSVTNKAGCLQRATLAVTGHTVNDRPVTLNTTLERETRLDSGLVLTSSRYDVHVHPRINGDDTVSLDADWTAALLLRVPGQPETVHLQPASSGSQRIKNGEPLPLASRTMQIGGGKSPALEAELYLFLTPTFPRTGS